MRKFAVGIVSLVCLASVLAVAAHWESKGPNISEGVGRSIRTASYHNSDISDRDAARSRVNSSYGQLPLAFERNEGQTSDQVQFLTHGAGYELFLTPQESVFVLRSGQASRKRSTEPAAVLRMNLRGANPQPSLIGQERLPGRSNYLHGRDPRTWHTDIPTYRLVREQQVYPGIDLVYYGNQGQLEYDFAIAPQVDPRVIRFGISGAEKLSISAQGDLLVGVAGGSVRFHQPVAYQRNGGEKMLVAANYLLEGHDTISFQLGDYDPTRELIIDPILSYSTYIGGSDIDGANAIAVAPDKTAFITGGTFSTDFPTAGTHPLQPNHGGPDDFSKDAFVVKLSADGATVLYATYLGGKESDEGAGIAVDFAGDAFVTGTTFSGDFPVTHGSFDTLCGGDGQCGATWNPEGLIVSNGFLSKLNPAGSALVYSGFIGVYENVECFAVAVDPDENAYVTGQTGPNITPTVVITPPKVPPPPFPITTNAFQQFHGGGAVDAFVTKISASGLSILYSTYLGGSNEDSGHGIAVDSHNVAYLTGLTYSDDLPLVNPTQGLNGGAGDAFVAKIDTATSGALLFSTYEGGAGLDQGNAIAVDATGDTYIAGGTNSDGLSTPGVLQAANKGQGDAFVAKYSTSAGGPARAYFTYLGGAKADSGNGIAVDAGGNAYVTGNTVSTDLSTTADAFQRTYGGGNADAFIAKLDPAGATLLYSSYLGGSNTESGNGIAIDSDTPPGAYVAGQTCSSDFPLSNPAQAGYGGNCDAYVSKVGVLEGLAIKPTGLTFQPQTQGTTSAAQTITLMSGVSAVNISSITLIGPNSDDFAISANTCGTTLAANSQCTISVDFTPSGPGTRTASVAIVDNVTGQPAQSLVASISGTTSTVPDFSVTTALSTATISAGQSATFTLNVTPVNGFNKPITLACSGLPAGASCSISPNPVTPSGAAATPVTVTIDTAVRNLVPPVTRFPATPWQLPSHPFFYVILLAALLIAALWGQSRRRPVFAGFGFAVVLLMAVAGCGGGNAAGVPAGTQAGTYTITVSATAGSLVHNTTLTLQVK